MNIEFICKNFLHKVLLKTENAVPHLNLTICENKKSSVTPEFLTC